MKTLYVSDLDGTLLQSNAKKIGRASCRDRVYVLV